MKTPEEILAESTAARVARQLDDQKQAVEAVEWNQRVNQVVESWEQVHEPMPRAARDSKTLKQKWATEYAKRIKRFSIAIQSAKFEDNLQDIRDSSSGDQQAVWALCELAKSATPKEISAHLLAFDGFEWANVFRERFRFQRVFFHGAEPPIEQPKQLKFEMNDPFAKAGNPKITKDVNNPFITVNGTPYPLEPNQADYLEYLITQSEYVSNADYQRHTNGTGARVDRLLEKLRVFLGAFLETDSKKGGTIWRTLAKYKP